MHTTLQLFVDGLSIGVVYMLMSSGFNLVMAVPNIIFIAFGQFYMLGAFVTWYLTVPGQNFFLGGARGHVASAARSASSTSSSSGRSSSPRTSS